MKSNFYLIGFYLLVAITSIVLFRIEARITRTLDNVYEMNDVRKRLDPFYRQMNIENPFKVKGI